MKKATLGIIEKDGKILLGLKGKDVEIGAGTLNGPGGKLDAEKDGDSLPHCMVREIHEEVRLVVREEDLEKIAIITFHAAGVPDFEVHVYRVHAFTGEPQATEEMVPDWYELTDETFARMLESDRKWLPQLLAGKKFNANVYYKERAKGFENIQFLPFTP